MEKKAELQMTNSQKPSKETQLRRLQDIADKNEDIFISREIVKLDIAQAQKSDQMSLIRKNKGEQYCLIAVSKIMKEACRFLPSKMTPDDIVYFSKFFVRDYWYWRFDDLILCLKRGIAKEYGDIYGEFNMSVFLGWADKYEKQKDDYFYNKHLEVKEPSNTREETKHAIYKQRQKSTELADIKIPNKTKWTTKNF